MTNTTNTEEKLVPLNVRIPEGLETKILKRAGSLMQKQNKVVTKTDVVIEMIELGFKNLNNRNPI